MEKNKRFGIMRYFAKYKFAITLYILTIILGGLSSIFLTIILADSIEFITLGNLEKALAYMLICLGITVGRRICWITGSWLYNYYSVKIMSNLNNDLSRQAFKLNSRTFSSHDTGTFVQRIVQDPERVVDNLASIIDVVADTITYLAMIIYIATLNVYISLIIFALIAVCLVIEIFRIKIRRKLKYNLRKQNDNINSLTTEIVRSERDIKSLSLENQLAVVSGEAYEKYKSAMFKNNNTDAWFWSIRNFIIETVNMLTLILALFLMDKALFSLSAFMVLYSNRRNIYEIVWNIGNVANRIIEIKVSSSRMFALFDEDEFVTEKFGNTNLDKIDGNIEFKNVGFSYIEYKYEWDRKKRKSNKIFLSENKIFDNLSFKIPKNSTVAFVGKSGSGKSTILNLIAKMNTVDSGEILIDNVNINDLNKDTMRSNFSLVNQFPYIFDMTIKENLKLAKSDATDDEIEKAIELSALKEFVSTLPNGINTRVGESGIKLSGGQKQRLAIARAMLRRSPIILFDESTSSLDNFAQEEVKKSIDTLKGSSTIVVVAHRLSTIKDSDIIFFLDNGKIIDSGTFDELYSKNESFQRMFLAENIENYSK